MEEIHHMLILLQSLNVQDILAALCQQDLRKFC